MTDILRVEYLSYRYPQGDHFILQDVSFSLKEGGMTCLLGANGCGKSTLLKILAQELPFHASSSCKGKIFYSQPLSLAYISQDLHQTLFTELTLEENLTLFRLSFSSKTEKKKYLDSYHPKLFNHLDHLLGTLSGGEKQAFALALALYFSPQFLLLDEHTSALDPEAEQRLMHLTEQKMKEQNITVLMCTHKIELVNTYADRILGMKKGKIVLDCSNSCSQRLSAEHIQAIYY